MKVSVKTPNRIDFAGGTLDLYPLYLFMNGGITVNAGVSIYSRVEITTREDGKIFIKSEDLDESAEFDSIGEMSLDGPTSFIQKVIKSYGFPSCGINVITENDAPKGSGLGASSSLLMALSGALLKINGESMSVGQMIDRGAAIEAGHLGIPTGKQDYYGAVLGKLHALYFDEKGCNPVEIVLDGDFREELEQSLLVSFTGISHYSGANNWDMLKMTIDRVGKTYENLRSIKEIASLMKRAFEEQNLREVASLVGAEWQMRKNLAPGVTNDFIDGVMEKAQNAGALASKLCGAGGGGCMITLVEPGRRYDVAEALAESGVRVMDAGLDYDGMQVEVFHEVLAAI